VIDHLAKLQAQFDGSQLARLANRLDSTGVGVVHCCSPLNSSATGVAQLRSYTPTHPTAPSSSTAPPASYGCVDSCTASRWIATAASTSRGGETKTDTARTLAQCENFRQLQGVALLRPAALTPDLVESTALCRRGGSVNGCRERA